MPGDGDHDRCPVRSPCALWRAHERRGYGAGTPHRLASLEWKSAHPQDRRPRRVIGISRATPAQRYPPQTGQVVPFRVPWRARGCPGVPERSRPKCLPAFAIHCATIASFWRGSGSLDQQVDGSIPARLTNLFPSGPVSVTRATGSPRPVRAARAPRSRAPVAPRAAPGRSSRRAGRAPRAVPSPRPRTPVATGASPR